MVEPKMKREDEKRIEGRVPAEKLQADQPADTLVSEAENPAREEIEKEVESEHRVRRPVSVKDARRASPDGPARPLCFAAPN